MLADSRVVYMFVYVSDLDASRAFYRDQLGLRVIEEDPGCVKFDCGHVILALNRAADFNISLPQSKDQSTEMVFLVGDMAEMHAALSSRGVQLSEPDDDGPGLIANFYDPDGHWFSLYEPSEVAFTWPSGGRIRALLGGRQNGNGNGAAARPGEPANGLKGLDGAQLAYTFLFVRNAAEAEVFYHDDLGLRDIEGGPCSTAENDDGEGVIKYDTGGVLVSTHQISPARQLVEGHLKGVASVFYVKNVEHAANAIKRRRPDLTPVVTRSGIGVVASLADPSGHQLYLYEPSEEALRTPSGQKIQEIMAAQF